MFLSIRNKVREGRSIRYLTWFRLAFIQSNQKIPIFISFYYLTYLLQLEAFTNHRCVRNFFLLKKKKNLEWKILIAIIAVQQKTWK